jgi:hypothetical protein
MDAWFDERTAGIVGGIVGSAIGIWGGVVGSTSGLCLQKGLKKLAYSLWGIAIAAGVILLLIGIIALFDKQPFHVYIPFLFSGVLAQSIFGGLFCIIRRNFALRERQIMEAHDL